MMILTCLKAKTTFKLAMTTPLSLIGFKTICLQILLALPFAFFAPVASPQVFSETPVNIYGDGEPDNGVEDSRQQLEIGRGKRVSLSDQRVAAGTVNCDGKIRGTAMVLDTREYAPALKGVVLISAAHVLFDLKEAKRFKRCEFHFLGLQQYAGYRVKIGLEYVAMGDFDPLAKTEVVGFGKGDWVLMYAPKVWRGFNPGTALTLNDFSFSQLQSYRQSGGEFSLIAFNSRSGLLSISINCNVIESRTGDIGGGRWAGQLLDDCDSDGGASGGGIVAVSGKKQVLVGIRSGSHWSEQEFPKQKYPNGPPDGSVWDAKSNTNFARAIDARIIQVLQEFTRGIELREATF